ncbi:bacteriocin-like protein [Chryseobacterium sp. Alg-005]
MKNLKKLSKQELKMVYGGIPQCLPGYYWCSVFRKCIPVGSDCGISIE